MRNQLNTMGVAVLSFAIVLGACAPSTPAVQPQGSATAAAGQPK
jgi:hypothetical protein